MAAETAGRTGSHAVRPVGHAKRRRRVRRRASKLGAVLAEPFLGSVKETHSRQGAVALTFDDGPDPDITPRLLDVLERRGARATFFVLASRAEAWPELVARARSAGHEIGLHGGEHRRLTQATIAERVQLVRTGRRRLERVLGEPVRLFRPPFGAQTPSSYLIARASGMQVIWWSAKAGDWLDSGIDELVQNAFRSLRPGGILLLHDGFEADGDQPAPRFDKAVLLARLLDEIDRRGWQAAPVGDLLSGGRAVRRLWFAE